MDLPIASIEHAQLLGGEGHAALTFRVDGGSLTLAFEHQQLVALLSVCSQVAAQVRAGRPDRVALSPVSDWNVGATGSGAVLVSFTGEEGAQLSYGLSVDQALQLRDAVTRAIVVTASGTASATGRFDSPELRQARERWRGEPRALELLDRCTPLLAQLDAANDEGQEILRINTSALIDCVRDRYPLPRARLWAEPTEI